MAIELSVKDVRGALTAAAGGQATGGGDPASLLVGSIFHAVFGDLVSDDPSKSGLKLIAEASANPLTRLAQLTEHTWRHLVAPRLLRHAASLQSASQQVITLWHATVNLCRWLDGIACELLERHPSWKGTWETLSRSLQAEVPLSCLLQGANWSEPVRLVGIADSVLRVPERAAFCAIELKLGRALPTVDLGQVVLYHLILSHAEGGAASSALSLLRFSPELEEHLVEGDALEEAKARLLDLIGRMAGVLREEVEPVVASPAIVVPSGGLATTPVSHGAPSAGNATPHEAHAEIGRRLVRAYREHGVGLELRGAPLVGPRFLRFEVRPSSGTRFEAIKQRATEAGLRLELRLPPMVVQEAGHLYIDVARSDPQTVPFAAIESQLPPLDPLRGSARIPLGVDPAGRLQFADLSSSGRSHVLVAGTTGSGKSDWLRMMLAGLMASNTPETLRLVTLDPKIAAFSELERSPFLWRKDSWWIPGQDRSASEVFQDLVAEMDDRYQRVRETGADDLREHVEKTGRPLARIVCVCDEYFALISQSKQEKAAIEEAVALLGAKGRAAGIHLVLATQQPSRKTLSGTIQANLPCRVALYLQNHIESNMILNDAGAERLTGAGDLLYKDFGPPTRLQAPYLAPEERKRHFAG